MLVDQSVEDPDGAAGGIGFVFSGRLARGLAGIWEFFERGQTEQQQPVKKFERSGFFRSSPRSSHSG